MVLNIQELIAALQNEVRIVLHLASKVDPAKLDYRPTAKQRSTIELLRYLSMMGPELVKSVLAGGFDSDGWAAAEEATQTQDLRQTIAAIGAHKEAYATLLARASDAEMRSEIEMFGDKGARGAFMVNLVLGSCAAYRMQLFLYLKASGREELNSTNLWGGSDDPSAGS